MPSRSVLQKRVGKYYLGRTIGEGTYSKVKYGEHVETGEAVAVKVLDKEHLIRTGMVEQIKREITILKQIHHPNVVDLKEVMASKDKIFVVMELVTGGELFDQIVAEGPRRESDARTLFFQLLGALEHCHAQGVYHRDLKPENVLLASDGTIKLSDFGLGALPESVRENGLLMTTCGTPNYVAPEVLAKRGYEGAPADVWSLGVVLYVVLAGCLPFDEDDLPTLFRAISAAQYETPPWLSRQAVDILRRMLDPNPHTRATLQELWVHPWVKSAAEKGGPGIPTPPAITRTPSATSAASGDQGDDIFKESVQLKMVPVVKEGGGSKGGLSSRRRLNAFELINAGLDISAIFEARDDIVTRRTRFTSRARPHDILRSVEVATVAIGGRVERRGEQNKLRLTVPNRKGPLVVSVEVFEVLPGKHITELSKVTGNTVEFYNWYGDLTRAVGPLIASQAGAAPRARQSSGGTPLTPRRMNAFELLNCCSAVNVSPIFDAGEDAGARHVQFTSQKDPEEIVAAVEGAVQSLGGTVARQGLHKLQLTAPSDRAGRSLVMRMTMIELKPGVHVVKISKDTGASMEFFRFYGQLASQMRHIMMKRVPHPHSSPLLSTTASNASDMADSSSGLVRGLSTGQGSGLASSPTTSLGASPDASILGDSPTAAAAAAAAAPHSPPGQLSNGYRAAHHEAAPLQAGGAGERAGAGAGSLSDALQRITVGSGK